MNANSNMSIRRVAHAPGYSNDSEPTTLSTLDQGFNIDIRGVSSPFQEADERSLRAGRRYTLVCVKPLTVYANRIEEQPIQPRK